MSSEQSAVLTTQERVGKVWQRNAARVCSKAWLWGWLGWVLPSHLHQTFAPGFLWVANGFQGTFIFDCWNIWLGPSKREAGKEWNGHVCVLGLLTLIMCSWRKKVNCAPSQRECEVSRRTCDFHKTAKFLIIPGTGQGRALCKSDRAWIETWKTTENPKSHFIQ